MSTLALGVLALILAVIFHYFSIFTKLRAVLGFIGTCIVTGGLFGHVLTWVVLHVAALTNSLTGKVFGVAIPGLIVIVLLVVFVIHLHPRGRGASKSTMFIGMALAACLVAGISSFTTLNHVPTAVRTGVSSSNGGR
jgi:hypothetical protein